MTSDARLGRRPAWVPTLAAFAAIALFVTAGNWQHRRLLEKEALQERSMRAMSLGPVPLPQGVPDWQAWRFRQVMVSGQYDAKRQILIDNKVHEQRPGFDVVTPLALADGRVVLVDRGWIAAGPTRTMLPDVPPPPGTITLRGRIDIPPADYYELGERRAPAGPVWQHLDPARFADATGVAVLPIVIEALDEGSGNGLVRDWPVPDAGMEQHLSYMVQWYTFAAMAAGLWVWFTFVRRRWRGAACAAGPHEAGRE